jgi:2-oxoglutarate dehydrogenase E1 component
MLRSGVTALARAAATGCARMSPRSWVVAAGRRGGGAHPQWPAAPVLPAAQLRCFGGGGSEFLTGANNAYLEEMYAAWQEDPRSVHKSWDVYFRTGQSAHIPNSNSGVVTNVDVAVAPVGAAEYDFRVLSLVRAYRSRGHEVAKLNPLNPVLESDLLNIESFGFSNADLDTPVRNLASMGISGATNLLTQADRDADGTTTLGELIEFLKKTYTGEAAYEFSHINDPEKALWLKTRVERVPVS